MARRRAGPRRFTIGEVVEVKYRHADDGEFYEHKFGPGVVMIAEPDGSLRIEKPGSRVWSDL